MNTLDFITDDPKAVMRSEAQRVRSSLTLKGDEAELAAKNFMAEFGPEPGDIVALYMPVRRELDTTPLIEALHAEGIEIALPVVVKGRKVMPFRRYHPGDPLINGTYDIPIPHEGADEVLPHYVVVPLLAFDRKGYRLGYGGGYYDATFAALEDAEAMPMTVGYAYAEQICLFPLPREDHDKRLDYVVTPQDVHDFRD